MRKSCVTVASSLPLSGPRVNESGLRMVGLRPAYPSRRRRLPFGAGRGATEIHPHQSANYLLANLPSEELARWLPFLRLVDMRVGDELHAPGRKTTHVYFPVTAIVSLLYEMANGSSAEIAAVGHEGVLGIAAYTGGDTTPSRAVVHSAGMGFRVDGRLIKEAFERSGPVLHLLLRYTHALITQMAQTAVCNRYHSLGQQLCRRLLLSLDRLHGDELAMTQDLIAQALGVRREGVTVAATALQQAGLIRYRRGHITVLDRKGLEQCSCEFYAVVKKEYDRLLPLALRQNLGRIIDGEREQRAAPA